MNPVSQDVKDMLESHSVLGLIFKDNLFIGKELPKPNNSVTIFDTPSYPPALSLDIKKYEYPSIQIRVRNQDYSTGWSLAEDIKDFLHGLHGQTWGGSVYTVIYCSSGPALLDWDENGLARFIVNFNLQRR